MRLFFPSTDFNCQHNNDNTEKKLQAMRSVGDASAREKYEYMKHECLFCFFSWSFLILTKEVLIVPKHERCHNGHYELEMPVTIIDVSPKNLMGHVSEYFLF